MNDLALRIQRLRPAMKAGEDFIVYSDTDGVRLAGWNKAFDPIPSDEELAAVDLKVPTTEESELRAAVQIFKNDVPNTWRDDVNPQRRIAWAMKRLLVEARQEFNALR